MTDEELAAIREREPAAWRGRTQGGQIVHGVMLSEHERDGLLEERDTYLRQRDQTAETRNKLNNECNRWVDENAALRQRVEVLSSALTDLTTLADEAWSYCASTSDGSAQWDEIGNEIAIRVGKVVDESRAVLNPTPTDNRP
jgi:hypothetical protein